MADRSWIASPSIKELKAMFQEAYTAVYIHHCFGVYDIKCLIRAEEGLKRQGIYVRTTPDIHFFREDSED